MRGSAVVEKSTGTCSASCPSHARVVYPLKRTNTAVADDTPSSTGASGSGSGSASTRSGSGSGVASAGPSTVPLPPMGMTERTPTSNSGSTLPSGTIEDEPDWRLPAELNPAVSVSSFNFDLNQNRLVPPGPLSASGSAPAPTNAGPNAPAAPLSAGTVPAPNLMGDSVMGMSASPAVGTSSLPISHDSVSPTTHIDQPLPQMEGSWMQPAQMQMGMNVPIFDRAVNDMWGLFVALDRGDNAVLVDSNLLRQLVAGAASGIGHPPMPGRA